MPLLTRVNPHIGRFQIRNQGTLGGGRARRPGPPVRCGGTDPGCHHRSRGLARRNARSRHPNSFTRPVGELAGRRWHACCAVQFPVWSDGPVSPMHEFARRHGDFAIAGATVAVELDTEDRVKRCAVGLLGLLPLPSRAPPTSRRSSGDPSPISPLPNSAGWHCPNFRRSRRSPGVGVVSHAGGSGHGRRALDRRNHGGPRCGELPVAVSVNGREYRDTVEPRVTLADHLPRELWPDRHPPGLRTRRLRCVQRAARRDRQCGRVWCWPCRPTPGGDHRGGHFIPGR